MLLGEIPWSARVWALPFLCALAPSERYAAERGRQHKKITEWGRQLLLLVRRRYPQRNLPASVISAHVFFLGHHHPTTALTIGAWRSHSSGFSLSATRTARTTYLKRSSVGFSRYVSRAFSG